jgi:hypothetical protein
MAAATFRRGKIEEYVTRLRVRKAVLKNQLEQPEFQESARNIKGQMQAVDQIIAELAREFQIELPEGVTTP